MLKTPLFPTYSKTKDLLKFLNGKEESIFKEMTSTIMSLRGTPQEVVNWQNPDEWIQERLKNEIAQFAEKIWIETNNNVNPRYIYGIQFLFQNHHLLSVSNGIFELTYKGEIFINESQNEIETEIDIAEGLSFLLYLCSIHKDASRKNFLKDWEKYLKNYSNYRKESVIKDSLRRRLVNLVDRKLISRDGNKYNITENGKIYLGSFKNIGYTEDEEQKLHQTIEDFNKKQRDILKEKLYNLKPFEFEHLIKDLLDAMNYDDVLVTSQSNDKGVDVFGTIQVGITNVTEVVQVKRIRSNIHRTILDQLRGSLHRFNAIQGTIITLSDFSKGTKEAAFEKGAAPITLINGEKLIDLLIKNEIIIKPNILEYYTVDNEYFSPDQEEFSE